MEILYFKIDVICIYLAIVLIIIIFYETSHDMNVVHGRQLYLIKGFLGHMMIWDILTSTLITKFSERIFEESVLLSIDVFKHRQCIPP